MVSVSKRVETRVEEMPTGVPFTAKDLKIKAALNTVQVALSRLVKKNLITRIQRGLYVKPKVTRFGTITVSSGELLNHISKQANVVQTGNSIFNSMHISTQVPSRTEIKMSKRILKKALKEKGFIHSKHSKVIPHPPRYHNLIEIVEALVMIKKVMDASSDDVINEIKNRIRKLSKKHLLKLMDYSIQSRPFVQAIIGAIFEELGHQSLADFLQKKLNPNTKFKIGITDRSLPTRKNWNIN